MRKNRHPFVCVAVRAGFSAAALGDVNVLPIGGALVKVSRCVAGWGRHRVGARRGRLRGAAAEYEAGRFTNERLV